jgi:hypothetical protein
VRINLKQIKKDLKKFRKLDERIPGHALKYKNTWTCINLINYVQSPGSK